MNGLQTEQAQILQSETALLIIDWLEQHVPALVYRDRSVLKDQLRVELKGQDGKDGKDGKDGRDGREGKDGRDGDDGKDGVNGRDGNSITHSEVDDNGRLVLSFSDGTFTEIGPVVGHDGKDGLNGDTIIGLELNDEDFLLIELLSADGGKRTGKFGPLRGQQGLRGERGPRGVRGESGLNGRGIQRCEVNATGNLILEFDDGSVGDMGWVGRGNVATAHINTKGQLILALDGGRKLNAGVVQAANGQDGADGPGFIWRGQFVSGVEYHGQRDNPDGLFADVVQSDGSSYVCTGRTISAPPSGNWDLMAAKGESNGTPQIIYMGGGGSGSGDGGGGGDGPNPGTFAPKPPAAVAVVGVSLAYSREDHVHPQQDLTPYVKKDGTTPFTAPQIVPNATLATQAVNKGQLDAAIAGSAGGNSFGQIEVSGQSTVFADVATDSLTLVAGSNVSINTNAATDTITIAATAPDPATAAPQAPAAAAAVGTSAKYAREDHIHPQQDLSPYVKADGSVAFTGQPTVPTATTNPKAVNKGQMDTAISTAVAAVTVPGPATVAPLAPAATAAVGTTTKYAREDHVHPQQDLTSYVKADGTVNFTGQITVPNGTTSPKAVNKGQLDTVSAVADAAMPKTGGTFTNQIVVPDAAADNQAVNRGQLNTAVSGVVVPPATAAPLPPAATAAVGIATKYAREDHVHLQQDLSPYTKKDGTVDFTGQVTVVTATTDPKAVNKGQMDSAIATAVGAVPVPGPATAAPLNPAASAAVGTATKYAREDHVHQQQDLTPYVKKDGSTAFTAAQTGIVATAGTHLVIKSQLDIVATAASTAQSTADAAMPKAGGDFSGAITVLAAAAAANPIRKDTFDTAVTALQGADTTLSGRADTVDAQLLAWPWTINAVMPPVTSPAARLYGSGGSSPVEQYPLWSFPAAVVTYLDMFVRVPANYASNGCNVNVYVFGQTGVAGNMNFAGAGRRLAGGSISTSGGYTFGTTTNIACATIDVPVLAQIVLTHSQLGSPNANEAVVVRLRRDGVTDAIAQAAALMVFATWITNR
jgi:hypothetical protein